MALIKKLKKLTDFPEQHYQNNTAKLRRTA